MHRIDKWDHSAFVPCGWLCTDCGQFKKDNLPNEMYADIGKTPTERKYDVLYFSYTGKRFFLNSSDIDY